MALRQVHTLKMPPGLELFPFAGPGIWVGGGHLVRHEGSGGSMRKEQNAGNRALV